MASSLTRRCLTPILHTAPSKLLHSSNHIAPITCWNISCRYFAKRSSRRRGSEEDFAGFGQEAEGFDRNDNWGKSLKGQNVDEEGIDVMSSQDTIKKPPTPISANKSPPQQTSTHQSFQQNNIPTPINKNNQPKTEYSWNKSSTQQPTNVNTHVNKNAKPNTTPNTKTNITTNPNTTNSNDSTELQGSTEEQVRTSEVEFIRFKEAVILKEQRMEEERVLEMETDMVVEQRPPERSKKQATKSFERFITIHYVHHHALPGDIRRSIVKQYGVEPKSISTYLDPIKNNVVWLVEFETQKQAEDVLATLQFRFEWLSPAIQPFTLPELPPTYQGKAVLINNLDTKVTTGDISDFLQDFGVITVENIGGQYPSFVVKLTTEDAAQAIVLMYHNYQYGKRQMAVYQLF